MNIHEKMRGRIKRYKEEIELAMPVRAICDYNKSLIMASVVNKDLEKYKGINYGKDVYIVGGGPSVKEFKHEKRESDIFIGINRAYEDERIEFDYLFKQDQLQDGFDEFLQYRNNECTKFLAIVPDNTYYKIKEFKIRGEYMRYVLASRKMKAVPFDISLEPFADLRGTVFSALQFAVYTNPNKIFLVGIDCSDSNYYSGSKESYRYQKEGWRIMKEALINMGVFEKVVSVNPVGLKGMFSDVYL